MLKAKTRVPLFYSTACQINRLSLRSFESLRLFLEIGGEADRSSVGCGLDGAGAVQDGSCHDRAVLGEGVGQVFAVLPAATFGTSGIADWLDPRAHVLSGTAAG